MGNGSSLFPKDTNGMPLNVEEVPLDLLRAISHASKILDWHENLVEEEIPPEWMWPFDEALNDWFDDIKAERAMASGKESDDRTVVPMMDNELAEGRGR